MSDSLVTILIPVYNAREYVRAAVESALAQTHQNLEILVVDDGSTDGSLEALEGIADDRLFIRRQVNRGKPAVFNAALEKARGDYLCVLDADDLMGPSRVAVLLERLEREPDLAAVFSGHDLLLGSWRGAPLAIEKNPAQCRADVEAFRMPAHDPTALYRISALDDLRMDEDLRIAQGLDFILRIGERSPLAVVGKSLYSYRVHGRSSTQAARQRRHDFVAEVLRRACARRGRAPKPVLSNYYANVSKGTDARLVSHLMDSVAQLRENGHSAEALTIAIKSLSVAPWNIRHYKPAFCAVMPSSLRRWIRRSERCRVCDASRVAEPAREGASRV
jgi:hypothetical protein